MLTFLIKFVSDKGGKLIFLTITFQVYIILPHILESLVG
jgi:hypothetical protein